MEVDADAGAYDALSQHPHIADLAEIARALMATATECRRYEALTDRVAELALERELAHDEAATSLGNAIDVLGRGPRTDGERALASALAAHVVRLHPPANREDEDRLANDLLWLALHTPFDATGLLDRALGEEAANLWDAIADRIRLIDRGQLTTLGRGEALLAGVALSGSRSKAAARQTTALTVEVTDRKVYRVLLARDRGEAGDVLTGDMSPPPRSPLATALLGFTGLLLLAYAVRLFGAVVLAYKRPGEARMSEDGALRVHYKTELLGRTLRDREFAIPRGGLALATREVRYPRLAVYAGLLALAVGSYVGVSAFVDGVRAASPSLLGAGLAIIALGLALDFVLSSLVPSARGDCRILFVSRAGQKLCISRVSTRKADAMLSRLERPPPA